jgi:glycerol kinase
MEKAQKYTMAIDQSTQTTKIHIISDIGDIVYSDRINHQQLIKNENWIEHDPIEILNNLSLLLDRLKKDFADFKHIKYCGITNQRETLVVWNKKTNKPLYNCIVWCDCRTTDLCKSLITQFKRSDYFQKKNGLLIDSYFTAFKLLWLLENVTEVKECYDKDELLIGTIDTWLLYNFSQEKNHSTDVTNASRTFLMNLETCDWDDSILKELNIKKNILPLIKKSTDLYGTLNVEGLEEIKITALIGDQQAASLSMGIVNATNSGNFENIKITYGTGCFMIISTDDKIEFKEGFLTTVLYQNINGKTTFGLEGSIESGGNTLLFLQKAFNLGPIEKINIKTQEEFNNDLIFTPPMTQIMSPFWKKNKGGALSFLKYNTTQSNIYKASLESIAFRVNQCLRKIELKGDLIVDGGLTNNDYLIQIQSNISRTNIKSMDIKDCTLFGAFLAASFYQKDFIDYEVISKNLLSKFKYYTTSKNQKELDHMQMKYENFDVLLRSHLE